MHIAAGIEQHIFVFFLQDSGVEVLFKSLLLVIESFIFLPCCFLFFCGQHEGCPWRAAFGV